MSKLRLTVCGEEYDRTRALVNGSLAPEGIELNYITTPGAPERHARMMQRLEFDVCELSTAQYLAGKTRGLAVTAIPVFVHRVFRHSYVYINTESGIEKPADLAGKVIGIRHYMNTASLWIRGMLDDDYGFDCRSATWLTDMEEDIPEWKPPEGLRVERRPSTTSLNDALVAGEVAAVLLPIVLPAIKQGNPKVRRLFPNYGEVQMDYFRRTRLFPVMHTIVVKDSVLAENPWVAGSLFKAFNQAKDLAYHSHDYEGRTMLVNFAEQMRIQREVMGDPWAYGLEPNRHLVEKMIEYAYNQGLIEYKPQLEDLFAAGSLEPMLGYEH